MLEHLVSSTTVEKMTQFMHKSMRTPDKWMTYSKFRVWKIMQLFRNFISNIRTRFMIRNVVVRIVVLCCKQQNDDCYQVVLPWDKCSACTSIMALCLVPYLIIYEYIMNDSDESDILANESNICRVDRRANHLLLERVNSSDRSLSFKTFSIYQMWHWSKRKPQHRHRKFNWTTSHTTGYLISLT